MCRFCVFAKATEKEMVMEAYVRCLRHKYMYIVGGNEKLYCYKQKANITNLVYDFLDKYQTC